MSEAFVSWFLLSLDWNFLILFVFDTIVCVLISYSRKAANLLSNDNFGASEDFEYDGPLLLTDFTSSNPLPLKQIKWILNHGKKPRQLWKVIIPLRWLATVRIVSSHCSWQTWEINFATDIWGMFGPSWTTTSRCNWIGTRGCRIWCRTCVP